MNGRWFSLKHLLAPGSRRAGEPHSEVLRAASMMTRVRNLPKLLNLIAQVLARSFRVSQVLIFLKDRFSPRFVLAASRGKERGSVE